MRSRSLELPGLSLALPDPPWALSAHSLTFSRAPSALSETGLCACATHLHRQESFVVLFSRSLDDVKKAQALIVHRDDYLQLIRLRKQVCQVYAEVPLEEKEVSRFPEHGVPEQFIACAQQLQEVENVCIAHVGPASRAVDVASEDTAGAKPTEDHNADDIEWEDTKQSQPTDADCEAQQFETSTAEDVIAVDHSNDPGLLETFAAFQTKLQAVNSVAARVMAIEQKHASERKENDPQPDNSDSVDAAGAVAAAKEECRTLVLEVKELAKNLTKPELKRMSDAFAKADQAVISKSGNPLSMLCQDTWPQCFLDFFYGDAVPNMEQRGSIKSPNHTVHVEITDLLQWLQDREELEYTLPSEAVPYKARAQSRFDTPEFTAIAGSVKRHLLILKGVSTVFRRQGYEADLKTIAGCETTDCVEALCDKSVKQKGLDELARAPNIPDNFAPPFDKSSSRRLRFRLQMDTDVT